MRKRVLTSLLVLLLVSGALPGTGAEAATLAFLSIDNMGMDPRYDYLEGIIRAVLLFDLSGREDVQVVNRADLESILREQELQMSTLAEEQNTAIKVKLEIELERDEVSFRISRTDIRQNMFY
jgi:hypothetical protein